MTKWITYLYTGIFVLCIYALRIGGYLVTKTFDNSAVSFALGTVAPLIVAVIFLLTVYVIGIGRSKRLKSDPKTEA